MPLWKITQTHRYKDGHVKMFMSAVLSLRYVTINMLKISIIAYS